MGYPMTYRRVVNRNGLEGGYDKTSIRWTQNVNTTQPGLGTEEQLRDAVWPHAKRRLEEYESHAKMLVGDLRRLEHDAVDENAICQQIARDTGIDTDTVAAVLKAFFAT